MLVCIDIGEAEAAVEAPGGLVDGLRGDEPGGGLVGAGRTGNGIDEQVTPETLAVMVGVYGKACKKDNADL